MSATPQRHEMTHKGIDPSGAEEWLCQECGRHFVIRWPPNYDRLVLHPGDESAAHFGRKGDAAVPHLQVSLASNEPSAAPDEDVWRRWLRMNGMDWDGWVT
jgi:hypothetical protein